MAKVKLPYRQTIEQRIAAIEKVFCRISLKDVEDQRRSDKSVKELKNHLVNPLDERLNADRVVRSESIDPRMLAYDAGVPQFFLKDAIIEINVGGNPEVAIMNSGEITITNWRPATKTRDEIAAIKAASGTYDPTRTWIIAATELAFTEGTGYWLYAKLDMTAESTTCTIEAVAAHHEVKLGFVDASASGYLRYKLGYITPSVDGKRQAAMLWGNALPFSPTEEDRIITANIIHISGFNYVVIVEYYFNGRYFNILFDVTLDPADATYDRIDVIVVNSGGEGDKVTGTPAAEPVKPTIDPATQLEVTFILVPANATEPAGVTDEIIYDENTEWTPAASGVSVNFDYATLPYHGSKCADVGAIGTNDTLTFTASAAKNVADYETLSLFLRLKNAMLKQHGLYVSFLLSGAAVSNEMKLNPAIMDTVNWQPLALDISAFTFSSATFDAVRLRWNKTGAQADYDGFYLDLVKLQAGITQPIVADTVQLTGDVLATGKTGSPIETTLKTVNANVGSFGSATKSVSITVDAQGRITAVSDADISGGGGIPDAPADGSKYARKDNTWVTVLDGADGDDGREVEISTSGGYIVWRYVGDAAWTNLVALSTLTGPQGPQGETGATGPAGADGDDGAPGADGVDAYVYVAYASDNAGTGFSLTPTDLLKYRAEIHVTTPLSPPVAADFSAATWVKYLGDDGTGGSGTIQVTGLTLLDSGWTLNSGLYEYDLSNANITANSIVEVIPSNADIAVVIAAQILPETDSASGVVTIYSVNEPTADISVTINITEKAS